MKAEMTFTINDEKNGYPNTKAALQCEDTNCLVTAYRASIMAGFNNIFGRNARKFTNLIVGELYRRNITTYTDIFGERNITKWTY